MRVVFMGTPEFAVPSLAALAREHEVVAVYTRPDAVSGRGPALRPSPVRAAAADLGMRVETPSSLRDPDPLETLRSLAPEVVCVAAYGLILPAEVLRVPVHGCVNVHASLLPRWRGAAPIQRAILEGDEMTGVSIMLMEEGLDTGPVAERVPAQVDDHSASSLGAVLAQIGAEALLRVLARVESGDVVWTPQPIEGVTHAAKIGREDVALAPELSAADADRRVRASSSSARASMRIGGRMLAVVSSAVRDADVSAGRLLVTSGMLLAGFADGVLELRRVRPDGRGEMDGAAFARGARLGPESRWEPAR